MNLLQPDLLAELHIAIDRELHGNLTVTKLHKVDELGLPDTVGQIIQMTIRMVCDWGHTSYGVRFSGWVGVPQPMRPELRALIEAATKAAEGRSTPAKMAALRAAVRAYTPPSG